MSESASRDDVRQIVTEEIDRHYAEAMLRTLARRYGITEQAMLGRLIQGALAVLPNE
ncbi:MULTISPECIES: hypothetical protein [Ralstonia solanacearum species complex]|uniref:hypothetical protein n=1 Tax=Ralstonia solanacearum species complex TaxID=3116862 RepID=UPI0013C328D7|nr:hypothetical protein [Ralstonia solanacearum]BEU72572.1 hypothetical protein MAFF211271_21270 [Ralstonia pseudosolanacearum]